MPSTMLKKCSRSRARAAARQDAFDSDEQMERSSSVVSWTLRRQDLPQIDADLAV
jgi:hypothetical protein